MPNRDNLVSVSYWFARIRRNLDRDCRPLAGDFGHGERGVFRARLFELQVVSKPSHDPLPMGYPIDCQSYYQRSNDNGTGRLR